MPFDGDGYDPDFDQMTCFPDRWETKDGTVLMLEDMDTNHLQNVLKKITREEPLDYEILARNIRVELRLRTLEAHRMF